MLFKSTRTYSEDGAFLSRTDPEEEDARAETTLVHVLDVLVDRAHHDRGST